MNQQQRRENGGARISAVKIQGRIEDEGIASIAGVGAREVEGVASLGTPPSHLKK
jgi:uncharacterized alkaline shock family protein YloU